MKNPTTNVLLLSIGMAECIIEENIITNFVKKR